MLAVLLSNAGVLVQAQNGQQVFQIELQDMFELIRYLIGLAFVIFGTFVLLYNGFATQVFLKNYDSAQKVNGLVISCEAGRNPETGGIEYTTQAIFSTVLPTHDGYIKHPDTETAGNPMGGQEYIHRFQSNWKTPPGTSVDLYCIPQQPQSAITKEFLDQQRSSFSWLTVISVLLPAIALGGLFVGLCITEVLRSPQDKHWVGWIISAVGTLSIFFLCWGICDARFCEHAATTYLSAHPVVRRVAMERPPSTIVLTPPGSPKQGGSSGGVALDPAGVHADQNLGISPVRSRSSLTSNDDFV